MKKIQLISLLIITSLNVNAQIDTVYFDEFNKLTTPINANVWQVIVKNGAELYEFTEFSNKYKYHTKKGIYSSLNPYIKNGECIYYDSLNVSHKNNYQNNVLHGSEYIYDSIGKLEHLLNYTEGRLNGACTSYFQNGNVRRIENYENGVFVSGKCYTIAGADTIFYRYYVAPEFYMGGNFNDFVNNNIKHSEMENGKCLIHFTINKDGSIDPNTIKIISKNIHPTLYAAAIRLVKEQPPYTPAIKEGSYVNIRASVIIEVETEEEIIESKKDKRRRLRNEKNK